jgi:hypothetical protein
MRCRRLALADALSTKELKPEALKLMRTQVSRGMVDTAISSRASTGPARGVLRGQAALTLTARRFSPQCPTFVSEIRASPGSGTGDQEERSIPLRPERMHATLKRWIAILATLVVGLWAGVTLSSDPEWRYLSMSDGGSNEIQLFDEADALFGRR